MIALLLRGASLAPIYLLVVTSLEPGDLLVGAVLGVAVAFAVRPRGGTRGRRGRAAAPARERLAAAPVLVWETAVEVVRGTWRVVRFCLGGPASPGLVEIPRAGRSRINIGFWAVLTGDAPDEVVVDYDEERDVLIVHLVDASDPEAVRARHARARESWQEKVVP